LTTTFHFRIRRGEQGITILLVAVCLAFVVLAFAALAVDVTALYTARTEARLAADAGALAGAKVLSVSGMTSDPSNTTLQSALIIPTGPATTAAVAAATSNIVGGRQLLPSEVTVSFSNVGSTAASFAVNPQVKVVVRRIDFPTFFAKIWGTQFLSVSGTAIAEAYNPSNAPSLASGSSPPIAPQCVMPWLIPNLDWVTGHSGLKLFDTASGAIVSTGMVGQSVNLKRGCATNGCNVGMNAVAAGSYYDAALPSLNPANLPSCSASACAYEETITGCSQTPIACNITSNMSIDLGGSCINYQSATINATNCRIHAALGQDTMTLTGSPVTAPPQIFTGPGNLLVSNGIMSENQQVTTSNSIVTIPVFDDTTYSVGSPSVNVIGFLQVFIVDTNNADGSIDAYVLNISGCGSTPPRTGNPVIGDGVSPVPVRLIQN
jgi:Putative Flp pilus-assembly TadE/G-like